MQQILYSQLATYSLELN